MINTWFKFEDKIQNTSKVIVFTRNHKDDDDADDDDGTKNNMSPPSHGGGGDIINVQNILVCILVFLGLSSAFQPRDRA